jgi:hypothetical protein
VAARSAIIGRTPLDARRLAMQCRQLTEPVGVRGVTFRCFDGGRSLKYGLLTYRESYNLGDEIQSLAARQFLPRVDFTVDREALSSLAIEEPSSLILNGWFMHHPENFPPRGNTRPLLTSMHISQDASLENERGVLPHQHLLFGERAEYFRRWGPVGGRDWHTVALLHRHDIPAYWSGCLTLTLSPPSPAPPRDDVVCAVDLGEAAFEHLQARCRTPLLRISHLFPTLDGQAKFDQAQHRLNRYSRCKAVVTTRLHCALPCLALGTPVLFVEAAADRYRFDGLRDLMHHVDRDCFLADRHGFDFDSPPANPLYYRLLRQNLIESVRQFIKQ